MNAFEMGSINSDFKVGTNADTIFERVISNISTKLKKKKSTYQANKMKLTMYMHIKLKQRN